jgi:hypothetical protein
VIRAFAAVGLERLPDGVDANRPGADRARLGS